jgi:NAD-dependent deacetylase
MQLPNRSTFDSVVNWLKVGRHIVVLSGAGLSKASGIPTYRDAGGLWTNGKNLRFSDIAAYEADPQGFLQFWSARRSELLAAQPNPAHRALVELQSLRPSTKLVTQNVDGLLTRAGAADVLELHGALDRSFCTNCGTRDPEEEDGYCTACKLRTWPTVRPAVVMFGEALDQKTLAQAEWASKQADVFVSVGTTALVYPSAGLSERAQARGAKLVVVNIEETVEEARADATLRGPAEQILPALIEAVSLGRSRPGVA